MRYATFENKDTFGELFEEEKLEKFLRENTEYRSYIEELETAYHTLINSRTNIVDVPELFDAHFVYYKCISMLEKVNHCKMQLTGDHPFSFEYLF